MSSSHSPPNTCQDAKIEYLKMIQAVIARMSRFGFFLKGWGVTLLAAILAVASQAEQATLLIAVALVPTIIFWLLDAFFLQTEHKYRNLYDHARQLSNDQVDFDLNPHAAHIVPVEPLISFVSSFTLKSFWGALLCVNVVALIASGVV